MVVQVWQAWMEHQALLVKWVQLAPTVQMANLVPKVPTVKMHRNQSAKKVKRVLLVQLVMLVTKEAMAKMVVKEMQEEVVVLEDQVNQEKSDQMDQSEVQEPKVHQVLMPNIARAQDELEVVVLPVLLKLVHQAVLPKVLLVLRLLLLL